MRISDWSSDVCSSDLLTARSNLAWPLTAVQSSTLFRARYTVLATICASHSIHQPAIGGAKAYQLSVSGPECVCVHAIITFSGRMAEDREFRSRTFRIKGRGSEERRVGKGVERRW